jgi:hypothetical protein
MGWDNLGGLGFGQALSHVHSAYKKEGRMLAGAQALFFTEKNLAK